MKAVSDPTELKNFLNYLSDKVNDADQQEVDQAIDRFLKEKLAGLSPIEFRTLSCQIAI